MNKRQLTFACILLVGIIAYTGYEIFRLSNRIQKIENKLGGSKRIACNEKDTVKKVRQSAVRIIGGEGVPLSNITARFSRVHLLNFIKVFT